MFLLAAGAIQIGEVLAAKGGGGGGGGGGKGGAGLGGGDSEEVKEAPPLKESEILKQAILWALIICITLCVCTFVYNGISRRLRNKIELDKIMGLCLPIICKQEEGYNPNFEILHGVGTDEEYIIRWVEDIWETYDFNDDGTLDKREMKKLVDQTLEQMSIMYPNRFPRHLVRYNEFDLDDFFNTIDIGQDGVISRTELKFFFKRLGKQEPDEFWKRKLGLKKIEKELNDKLEDLKEK